VTHGHTAADALLCLYGVAAFPTVLTCSFIMVSFLRIPFYQTRARVASATRVEDFQLWRFLSLTILKSSTVFPL
jgi:hypothetical protein